MIVFARDPAPPAPARATQAGWIPGVLAAVWVVVLVAGMGILWRYKSTSGPRAEVPRRWPGASTLRVAEGEPTLVLFVHPCCPCTRASLTELAGLLPRFAGRLKAYVASFRPTDPPEGWSEATGAVESLSGATLVMDAEGREAARFGVVTSGHVLLYGKGAQLCYSGGITSARGHVGDNPGLAALERALAADLAGVPPGAPEGAPVFGCSLFDPDSPPQGRP